MATLIVSTTENTAKVNGKTWVGVCDQCGRDMGYEWLLGPVCGRCCRANHRRVLGRMGRWHR